MTFEFQTLMMKRSQVQKSKRGNHGNDTIKKSKSDCGHGSSSIIALFRLQQQRWDTMWGSSNQPENNVCSTSMENERHLGEESGIAETDRSIVQNCGEWKNVEESPITDLGNENVIQNCDNLNKDAVCSTKINVVNNSVGTATVDTWNKKSEQVHDVCNTKNNRQARSDPSKHSNSKLSLKRRRSSSAVSVLGKQEDETAIPDKAMVISPSSKPALTDSLDLLNASHLNENVDPVVSTTESDGSSVYSDYYLDNFLLILDVVLSDDFHTGLFNEDDLNTICEFQNSLSEAARKLYVRLFLRKHKWIRKEKITYPLIAEDLSEALDELKTFGLLCDEADLTDLEETMHCLPAADVKTLAKTLRISPSSKASLSTAIVKHAQRSNVTDFFAQTTGSAEKMVMKRAKSMLGRCYRLTDDKRQIFIRIMILFGVHNTIGDDDSYGQQLIFQMLMTQIGRIRYPEYEVLRKTKIFSTRDSVVRYAEALQLESEICQELEKKDYEKCLELYMKAKRVADCVLKNANAIELDTALPVHLRLFTPGAIYCRLLTYGVEILQFIKKYGEAVDLLQELLSQNVYHQDYRGRWYDRLALNLDFHLKRPLEALVVIKSSLKDFSVRTGHRYNLFQRAKKICSSAAMKKSAKSMWEEFQDDDMNSVLDAPTVTITGHQLFRNIPGCNAIWIGAGSSSNEATVTTRVEEVALNYYAENGYPQGLHAEGATFRCLFSLFMWDILFLDGIEDAFYNQYQTYPLDMLSDSFFTSRQVVVADQLRKLSDSSLEELCETFSNAWELHKDTLCFGINWELFQDCDHALGLVKCIGGAILAGIFTRMARLMRSVTGGVPDLVVWNPETLKFKIVEVKGPGDRLSTKQILWLDYLLRLGVDAEVCHVRAVGGKAISSTR